MPETPEDAPVNAAREKLPILASLYNEFAYSIDPFSRDADFAEQLFNSEMATLYDSLPAPKPCFEEFRKGVIVRCIRYLRNPNNFLPSPPP